jgi:large subunit ribosomal protein L13
MVPKNRLGRVLMTKLKVYKGPAHPHSAQEPATLKADELKAKAPK